MIPFHNSDRLPDCAKPVQIRFQQFAGDGVTPLAGVIYAIRSERGEEILAVSDREGLVTFELYRQGEYTMTESLVPLGFLVSPVRHHLLVFCEDGSSTIDGEPIDGFSKRTAPGYAFTFSKAAEDGISPMPNAAYELSQRGVPQYEALSGRDGLVHMLAPAPGKYQLREIATPDGCLRDPAIYPVTILRNGRTFIGDRESHGVVLHSPGRAQERGAPKIFSICAEDLVVSGSGVPGASLVLLWPNGDTEEIRVGESGNWMVPVPDDMTLRNREWVSVAGRTDGRVGPWRSLSVMLC